jgi:hypothetical protein
MWEKFKNKIRKYMFINYLRILKVELAGIEPASKHIRHKLSTCLFMH